MKLTNKLTAVALGCSIAMVGCGGGSLSDDTVSAIANSEPSNGTFFNDQDGIDFASSLGFDMKSVVNRALDSSNDGLANAAENDDPTSGVFNDDSSVEQCDSGSLSSTVNTNAAGDLENATIVANDCLIDGQTTSGSLFLTASSSAGSDTINVEFADFGSTGVEGDSFIDGDVTMSIGEDLATSISGTRLTMTAAGETTEISNFALITTYDDSLDNITVDAQATISSSAGGAITFATGPAFFGPLEGNPVNGVLVMTHSDSSTLTIDANTSDPETFAYTLNGNGMISNGVSTWKGEDLDNLFQASSSLTNTGF